jgi:hypothetical protein
VRRALARPIGALGCEHRLRECLLVLPGGGMVPGGLTWVGEQARQARVQGAALRFSQLLSAGLGDQGVAHLEAPAGERREACLDQFSPSPTEVVALQRSPRRREQAHCLARIRSQETEARCEGELQALRGLAGCRQLFEQERVAAGAPDQACRSCPGELRAQAAEERGSRLLVERLELERLDPERGELREGALGAGVPPGAQQ